MAQYNAMCPNCRENVYIDSTKEANVCPNCKDAFVTEKAIQLYNGSAPSEVQVKAKKRHVLKSLGKGLLMALECIGYLLYVLCLVWLFVDITDDLKKK